MKKIKCPITGCEFCPKSFYLSHKGRITRQDFWIRLFLPVVIIGIIISVIENALGLADDENGGGIISLIFMLIILWPSIVVQAKRLHDREKSGWWQLIYIIPIIGWIWAIIEQGVLKGTVGDNKYGPAPK